MKDDGTPASESMSHPNGAPNSTAKKNPASTGTHSSKDNDIKALTEAETTRLINAASTSLFRFSPSLFTFPMLITSAEGVYIMASNGKRVLDFTSGQMSCLLGHSHPDIVRVISQYAGRLDHLFTLMLSEPVVGLAEKLKQLLGRCVGNIRASARPSESDERSGGAAIANAGGRKHAELPVAPGLDRCLFLSTGGESNEAAVKIAKMYTGKFEIVGLSASWHGMTHVASAATYTGGRKGYGPHVPGNLVLPSPNAYRSIFRHADGSYDWRTELSYGWSLVDASSVGSLAAVIIEPILSAGGMHPLPPGYLRAIKEECEKRNMLLIIDEAQTGLGRTGKWFGFQHDGVVPDILTLSKTLGNGIPLSAVITSAEIEQTCFDRGFYFYTTHCNDPLPAAVGLEVLEIVERDGLVEHVKEMGDYLLERLRQLQSKYGCIGDVRGRGLMVGVEIVESRETKKANHKVGWALGQRMMDLGLSANIAPVPGMGDVFRIAPPIVVTKEEIDEALAIMETAFKETEGTLPVD